ncbi:hypothetical protein [Novilysobacter erysipheiresistens]|uniref:Uncharacterized protein n=1 Tax=Novilysobacter erysipheiresistens TaxID=1749332 RepID=A0ABU7YUW2_9GAMM
MSSKDIGDQPAHPFAQTSESYQITGTQHSGLTKRESAAIASLQGQRAGGSKGDPEQVGKLAWADADALFAASGKDGAA